ncbi:MAG: TIGR00725 family protein [Chloroflexi bacterium]|nr:TIGR00725 family protein [Chloroflexota bacterium]
MDQTMQLIISVIGGSTVTPDVGDHAEAVGRELAKRGAVVVCGGLTGVMERVCKGAREAGGLTIGILPGDDRKAANPHVAIAIPTGMGVARNAIVVKAGQAVIAIDGSYGTLSEIGIALAEGIPVVGLDTWGLMQNGQPHNGFIAASDPVDAVEKAVKLAKDNHNRPFNHWRNR